VSEVGVVYKCVLCSKAFNNVQSLRAHMKVHRDVEFEHFHVRLPRAKVEEFKEFCRRHNTTTCHMILAMIDAYIEGDKRGLIQIGSPNPAIVHLHQFFAARPRGHGKYDAAYMTVPVPGSSAVLCLYCDGFREGEVFCQRYGADWVPASKCSTCPKNRIGKKPAPS
jgi:hypothetical protein